MRWEGRRGGGRGRLQGQEGARETLDRVRLRLERDYGLRETVGE